MRPKTSAQLRDYDNLGTCSNEDATLPDGGGDGKEKPATTATTVDADIVGDTITDGTTTATADPPSMTWEQVLEEMDKLDDPVLKGDGEPTIQVDFNTVMSDLEAGVAKPGEVKAVLGALRGMGTKRSQRTAEKEKKLDRRLQELEEQQAALLKGDFRKKVDERARPPEEPPKMDPFDPDSVQKYIAHQVEHGVAQAMQGLVGELDKSHKAQAQARGLTEFKHEHPEITTDAYKLPIARLLRAHQHLTLQQAYDIVDAGVKRTALEESKTEAARMRRMLQDRGLQTGGGRRAGGLGDVPQHLIDDPDPTGLFEYLEAQEGGQA